MLPIRGLYEVAIRVKQLPRAEAFYRDILGLEVGIRDERRSGCAEKIRPPSDREFERRIAKSPQSKRRPPTHRPAGETGTTPLRRRSIRHSNKSATPRKSQSVLNYLKSPSPSRRAKQKRCRENRDGSAVPSSQIFPVHPESRPPSPLKSPAKNKFQARSTKLKCK